MLHNSVHKPILTHTIPIHTIITYTDTYFNVILLTTNFVTCTALTTYPQPISQLWKFQGSTDYHCYCVQQVRGSNLDLGDRTPNFAKFRLE